MAPPFSPPRLRSHRTAAGQTRTDLALRAELSAETIAALERGTITPSQRAIARMAAALDCAPLDLCDQGDPASPLWKGVCAALPPLDDDELLVIGDLLHRIDTRRALTGRAAHVA